MTKNPITLQPSGKSSRIAKLHLKTHSACPTIRLLLLVKCLKAEYFLSILSPHARPLGVEKKPCVNGFRQFRVMNGSWGGNTSQFDPNRRRTGADTPNFRCVIIMASAIYHINWALPVRYFASIADNWQIIRAAHERAWPTLDSRHRQQFNISKFRTNGFHELSLDFEGSHFACKYNIQMQNSFRKCLNLEVVRIIVFLP